MCLFSDNPAAAYSGFLQGRAAAQWRKAGLRRRAGAAVPLFSVYSTRSVGSGEIPDIKLLSDWCASVRLSIIQLLPLNDTGYDFQPYSAQSSFALDPLYLNLGRLVEVPTRDFHRELNALRERFPVGGRVDYAVKAAKMDVLRKMFSRGVGKSEKRFRTFREKTAYWLRDFSLYRAVKESRNEEGWENWPEALKRRDAAALDEFEKINKENVLFQQWLQWQLFEQMTDAKAHAGRSGVLLMGDMPFLVARDSADVWARQDFFKLNLSSGAPPDLYFAAGQRWGMPPYRWEAVEGDGFSYVREKLHYAENFYDMYRVDHVIGVFRIYTIPLSTPPENGALRGVYDPADESLWEEHGRKILKIMLESSSMLPCGEDLGAVPACSTKVLSEWAIPGLEVQRWTRDWSDSFRFRSPEVYRKNSAAVVSTHDMSIFAAWWFYEAGTVEEDVFRRMCSTRGFDAEDLMGRLFDMSKSRRGRLLWRRDVGDARGLISILGRREDEVRDFMDMFKGSFPERELFWKFLGLDGDPMDAATPTVIRRALEKAGESASIFSLQLLQDWLSLGNVLPTDPWECRVNFPGITGPQNWSFVVPLPLEDFKYLPLNKTVRDINIATGRS